MWFPLCNVTHYSLQKGFSKPAQLVEKCVDNGYKACGIADYKSISGSVSFFKACKKSGITPIIGCSFDGYKLFAKNKDGWDCLVRIVSSLDDDGNIDPTILRESCNRGSMFCVADKGVKTPINGGDLYRKTSVFRTSYYINQEDAELHRILLCSGMKTTLPAVRTLLSNNEPVEGEKFFLFQNFHVFNLEESTELLLEDTSNATVLREILGKCEDYDILNAPILPKFPTPNGESEKEYLKQLCRDGWRNRLGKTGLVKDQEKKNEYHERFVREFDVIDSANLFGYFLVVQDIIRFAKENEWLVGPGRGSAAGCLISFLIGITDVDPIEFDLIFERFYNAGRNTADHVSLPDIDMDVPAGKRDEIIKYIKDTYGHAHVSQMITYSKLSGKSAIKEVLRINNACGFGEMNEMCKYIPGEAAISDQLQQMDEEDRSILRWALIHNDKELMDFCHVNEKGELEGDYAQYFQQAIDIEGTFKSQGKHAAGVVISKERLSDVCPMTDQNSGNEKIAGLEMNDLEDLGHVKFDVLGLTHLDKMMKIDDFVEMGHS